MEGSWLWVTPHALKHAAEASLTERSVRFEPANNKINKLGSLLY